MSRIIVFGRICNDLVLARTTNGKSALRFTLAEKAGKDETNFFDCQAYGVMADNICKYASKGDLLYVDGKGHFYTKTKGDRTYKNFIVIVSEFRFAGNRKNKSEDVPAGEDPASEEKPNEKLEVTENDVAEVIDEPYLTQEFEDYETFVE